MPFSVKLLDILLGYCWLQSNELDKYSGDFQQVEIGSVNQTHVGL